MNEKQQILQGKARVWGVVACVLFLLAAFAGLDALQSYWRSHDNELRVVGGESIPITGPMPKSVVAPQYLQAIWLGSAKLSFVVKGESENDTNKKATWQAELHVGKVQRVQTGTLVVEDLLLATDKETGVVTKVQNTELVYSVVIFPSAEAMQEALPGFLPRYIGVAGAAAASALAALGTVCAGVGWWFRRNASQGIV